MRGLGYVRGQRGFNLGLWVYSLSTQPYFTVTALCLQVGGVIGCIDVCFLVCLAGPSLSS